jgi:hypothetical protein
LLHHVVLLVRALKRWQSEGLGSTRRAIARSAPAPIVFIRRGQRRGALAPAGDVTQFGWSSAGFGGSRIFSRAFSRLDIGQPGPPPKGSE